MIKISCTVRYKIGHFGDFLPSQSLGVVMTKLNLYNKLEMWADAQRDGRSAKYRWRPLRKFRNSIPCTTPQRLADARCCSAVQ